MIGTFKLLVKFTCPLRILDAGLKVPTMFTNVHPRKKVCQMLIIRELTQGRRRRQGERTLKILFAVFVLISL